MMGKVRIEEQFDILKRIYRSKHIILFWYTIYICKLLDACWYIISEGVFFQLAF